MQKVKNLFDNFVNSKMLFKIRFEQEEVRKFIKIFYMVGILGISLPWTHIFFLKITPFGILLISALLALFHKHFGWKQAVVFTIIVIGSFILEMVGVHTGKLFGNYSYGDTLGLKLSDTPVIIGVNWLLLVYCTHAITLGWKIPVLLKVLLASVLMVVYDIALEPAAMAMDMWQWEGGRVPMQNYLVWFGASVFFHSLVHSAGIKIRNALAGYVFLVQLFFFIVLDLYFLLIQKL
jgi:uncharacterized membrane protein